MVKFNQLEKDLSQIEERLVRVHEPDLEQDRNITELKTKIASANNTLELITHTDYGIFDCATHPTNTTQLFKDIYPRKPHVYLYMSELEGVKGKKDTWYDVEVYDVQRLIFSVHCTGLEGSQFERLTFKWLSFPSFE